MMVVQRINPTEAMESYNMINLWSTVITFNDNHNHIVANIKCYLWQRDDKAEHLSFRNLLKKRKNVNFLNQ